MYLHGIYIDDAGNPGASSPSKFFPESKKSWCGVIIPSKISNEISTAMSIFLNGVKMDYGVEELHFTDIYSGRGAWKSVSVKKRIEVFDLMSLLCTSYNLLVFYQTWSKEFKSDHKEFIEAVKEFDREFWDMESVAHFGLILLLVRLKEGMRELRKSTKDFNECFQVYIDEGIAKAGSSIQIPLKGQDIFEQNLYFDSSKNNFGIQIADFLAFIISRSQWLMMKKKAGNEFSEADRHILSINSKLNHWTLGLIKVNEATFSKEGLEFLMMRDRQNKGLLPVPK